MASALASSTRKLKDGEGKIFVSSLTLRVGGFGGGIMQLAPQEQHQLLTKVLILEQHLQDPENWTHKTRDRNKNKFVSRMKAHGAKSTKYMVEESWGLNNAYLCKMRKRIRNTEHTDFGSLVAPVLAARWYDDNIDKRSS